VEEAGADVESKDSEGKTALDRAREAAQSYWWEEKYMAVVAWLEAWLEKKGGEEAGD
jgi:hypothetical protein